MKYFIDAGSHLFQSVQYFSTIHKPHQFNVFCFEPAYDHDLKEEIDNLLPSISSSLKYQSIAFFPVAVSTKTGIARFKRDLSYPKSESSSLRIDKDMSNFTEYLVPTIDMAHFIQAIARPNDHLILKLDIEGHEYDLISHLASTGALSLIDELYLELHEYKLSGDITKDYMLLDTLAQYNIVARSWDAASCLRLESPKDNLDHECIIDKAYLAKLYSKLTTRKSQVAIF